MSRPEAEQVARDVLLAAGSTSPVVCFQHEPEESLWARTERMLVEVGGRTYLNPREVPDWGRALMTMAVCVHCRCVYDCGMGALEG